MSSSVCPLCMHEANLFYESKKTCFLQCSNCKGIFSIKENWPNAADEKARYDTHNNDVDNPGYQNFVQPIVTAVAANFGPQHTGLDFGAGPGPVSSFMLGKMGYSIALYDPFYHNNPEVLNRQYNYIICCEVMEHFHSPPKEFALLRQLLLPGGKLFCMTSVYSEDINFEKWYYKNDKTHVFMYHAKSLEYIYKTFGFAGLEVNGSLVIFSSIGE